MALVSKILESTLTAGSTTVTFTDSDIPNSLIRVFSSNSDIIPESRMLSGNTLTVTYAPQSNNIDVAVEIVKQGLDIVDNVLSEDTDKALSAKQGYLLSAAIGDVSDRLSTLSETVNNLDIPDNITDLTDVNVTSIQDGQVLAWDEDENKFVNVNQSGGGGSVDFTSVEQLVGTYMGKNLYKRTFEGTPASASPPTVNTTQIGTRTDLGINIIVFIGGYLINEPSNNSLVIPGYVNSNTAAGVYTSATGVINLYNIGGYTKYSITLWYTKD